MSERRRADVSEHASSRRGLWISFTNAGAPPGVALSTLLLAVSAAAAGEVRFLAWGWRLPSPLSIVLPAIGLFVRSRVAETHLFAEAAHQARPLPLRSAPPSTDDRQ